MGDGIQASPQFIYEQLDKYRKLRLSREEAASMNILNELAELDVMNRDRHRDPYLENYSEGPLVFLPTSTIDIDRTYSQSEKPSWSHRILVHND
jgi:hypothetical protein